MFPGETVLTGGAHPGTRLRVLHSEFAGWYVGFVDRDGIPYSRESVYYDEEDQARLLLEQLRS